MSRKRIERNKKVRVTSLDQLSRAEFSGEYIRLKVYENDHKKILDIWLDLILKVKYSKILIFRANLYNLFFSLKNTKMGYLLLFLTYFDNFDF